MSNNYNRGGFINNRQSGYPRPNSNIWNNHSYKQTQEKLQYLYDIFGSSLETQIIDDVVQACDQNIEIATEQLLQLISGDQTNLHHKVDTMQQSTASNTQHPNNKTYTSPAQLPSLNSETFNLTVKNSICQSSLSAEAAEFVPNSFNTGRKPCPIKPPPPALSDYFFPIGGSYKGNSCKLSNEAASKANNNRSKNNVADHPTSDNSFGLKNKRTTLLSSQEALALVKKYATSNEKVMILLRGCPGSGKTTLAKHIRLNGVVLSTDDYFNSSGRFTYCANQLTEAHDWNKERTKKVMEESISPVIIDNTNTQVWEMLPYVSFAKKHGYHVEVIEPAVHWRMKPGELARLNTHGVRKDKIMKMLDRYEGNITGNDLLQMMGPEKEDSKIQEEHNEQLSKFKSPLKASSTATDKKDFINLMYGERRTAKEEESNHDGGEMSSSNSDSVPDDSKDDSIEKNKNAAMLEWDGECATMREWMDWGENREQHSNSPDVDDDDDGEKKQNKADASDENGDDLSKKDPNFADASSVGEVKDQSVTDTEEISAVLESDKTSFSTDSGEIEWDVVEDESDLTDDALISLPKRYSKSVETSARDLMMIDKLERENYQGYLKDFCSIITPNSSSTQFSNVPSLEPSSKIPDILYLHQSAQTDDTEFLDVAEQLDLLAGCFPSIDPDHLKFLYESCGRNSNALADILSEFGYHFNEPTLENQLAQAIVIDKTPKAKNKQRKSTCIESVVEDAVNPAIIEALNGSSVELFPTLNIGTQFGQMLFGMFGFPSGFKAPVKEEDYNVKVNAELAEMIYKMWTSNFVPDTVADESPDVPDLPLVVDQNVNIDVSKHLSTKIKRKQLEESFPGINKKILENIFEASGYSLQIASEAIRNSPELTAPPKTDMTKEFIKNLENDLMKKALEASIKESTNEDESQDDTDSDRECSDMDYAYEEMVSKMNESFRQYKLDIEQTKKAFGLKKFAEANFYSSRAHVWRNKYVEEKQLSGELRNNKIAVTSAQSGSVDLHGLKVRDALNLLPQVLSTYRNGLIKKCKIKKNFLFVITGRGSHSVGGVPKIKPAIEDYLKKHKFFFTEATPGILKVHLRCS